jgi:hypothetical protein
MPRLKKNPKTYRSQEIFDRNMCARGSAERCGGAFAVQETAHGLAPVKRAPERREPGGDAKRGGEGKQPRSFHHLKQ